MIRPILPYGHPLLRKPGERIGQNSAALQTLIDDLWATMENANGCGLAANQAGADFQLFIVDSRSTYEALSPQERAGYFDEADMGHRETFINAEILSQSSETWTDDEGCLSVPGISAGVTRPWAVTMRYLDRNFVQQEAQFSGTTARMILHEFDHTQGRLYLDHLSVLQRRLLHKKLESIRKGNARTAYPMLRFRT